MNLLRYATLLAAILAAAAAPPPATDPPSDPTEITVQVLDDAWRVGDEKTYTLLFDRAPFGRHAMSLVELRDLPGGGREAIFAQRITLDLRALGQQGMLQQTGTLVYRRDASGPYRYQEVVVAEGGYETYRRRGTFRSGIAVDLDPEARSYDVSTLGGKDADAAPLPAATGAILLDLLALGHWERVFSQHRHWPLGGTVKVRLLVPTAAPRFDYHLPVSGQQSSASAACRTARPARRVCRSLRVSSSLKERLQNETQDADRSIGPL